MASYKQRIPFPSLPQTLQDAIIVTQRLGHRYLWVDALCIVQDDETSKQIELAQMGRIYTSSFLTMQASDSDSVNKGFIALRRRLSGQPLNLAFRKGSTAPGGHMDSSSSSSYVHARLQRHEPLETPTSRRAWVFQETVLPSRLLVYTRWQVVLVCREEVFSEDGMGRGIGHTTPMNYRHIRPPGGPADGQIDNADNRTLRESALSYWYSSISVCYSGRAYSVSDDRLNALSAYAGEAHQTIGGRYLAGIWEVDLARGLQWASKSKPLKRAAEYRAPSWSWAAYDGQFSYTECIVSSPVRARWLKENGPRNRDLEFKPRVIEAWTTTKAGISQFGTCRDGRIVIETLVGPAIATKVANANHSSTVQLQTVEGGQNICIGILDTAGYPLPLTVFCASLTGIAGLMLVASGSSEGRKEFQRVGIFKLSSRDHEDGFEAWRRLCRLETVALI